MITTYIPENYNKIFPDNSPMNTNISDIEYVKNGTICVNASASDGHVYDADGNLCESSITYRGNSYKKNLTFQSGS